MKTLTDMQLVLLTTAAQRESGSLLPPPDTLGAQMARIRKAVTALVGLGLAAEIEVADRAASWREHDSKLYGVTITEAGRERIGVALPPALPTEPGNGVPPESALTPPTKSAQVVELLSRDGGASVADIVAVTGWLPHTTRAALTGLRKKGHAIVRDGERGALRYRIATA
ncbi:DUF3489 domain-containing protein [Sphingomonas sp. 1P06PA]|uniref:DUF3489 domain-containing protein n=1 Tax=Sphingomonas sp. 1P06PA TaxID=554121 RepID=UPI0039A4BC86